MSARGCWCEWNEPEIGEGDEACDCCLRAARAVANHYMYEAGAEGRWLSSDAIRAIIDRDREKGKAGVPEQSGGQREKPEEAPNLGPGTPAPASLLPALRACYLAGWKDREENIGHPAKLHYADDAALLELAGSARESSPPGGMAKTSGDPPTPTSPPVGYTPEIGIYHRQQAAEPTPPSSNRHLFVGAAYCGRCGWPEDDDRHRSAQPAEPASPIGEQVLEQQASDLVHQAYWMGRNWLGQQVSPEQPAEPAERTPASYCAACGGQTHPNEIHLCLPQLGGHLERSYEQGKLDALLEAARELREWAKQLRSITMLPEHMETHLARAEAIEVAASRLEAKAKEGG